MAFELNSPLSVILDTVGDGTGETNANADFFNNKAEFKFKPVKGDICDVTSFLLHLEGSNAPGNGYAAINPLVNGVRIEIRDNFNNSIHNLTPIPIRKITDLGKYSYDLKMITLKGPNKDIILWKWDFIKSFGIPLRIDSDKFLVVTLQDDMSELLDQSFTIQGLFSNKDF